MVPGELASGQKSGWSFLQKLGEGDAGEVFLVQSLVDQSIAILKRPLRSLFTTQVLRQANQIDLEGKFLRALGSLNINYAGVELDFPTLVDTSKQGTEFSDRLFIVISKAEGDDLESLAKYSIQDPRLETFQENGGNELHFVEVQSKSIKTNRAIPDLLILRVLGGILEVLEAIHSLSISAISPDTIGFIWNDVKPAHIFWNPAEKLFTIIDWGNAQPLVNNGASSDRHFSVINDYQQYLDVFGRFLHELNPDLYQQLQWPESGIVGKQIHDLIDPLKERIDRALEIEVSKLRTLRHKEGEILLERNPSLMTWEELSGYQNEILTMGEIPDWSGAERLATRIAADLVNDGSRIPFFSLCEQVRDLPASDLQKWALVLRIASFSDWPGLFQTATQKALLAALENDWANTLWILRQSFGESHSPAWQDPTWWQNLCGMIRAAQPEIGEETLTPLTILNRLVLTLRAEAQKETTNEYATVASSPLTMNQVFSLAGMDSQDGGETAESLAKFLKEVIIKRWVELEPDPPNAGLEYREIEEKLELISKLNKKGAESVKNSLEQPRALVNIILDSWNRREFETARKGLRRLLLWDPDRQRVFMADQAISKVANWLESIRQGPSQDVSLPEFITRHELRGREMRNQVGSARWLDQILEAFSRLRKGATPADVLMEFPDLRSEIPWLLDYHPPLVKVESGPVHLTRSPGASLPDNVTLDWVITNSRVGEFGNQGELTLGEPLDNWAPEALGSSARVFRGFLVGTDGRKHETAIKVMRPGLAGYAVPLFQEEADVLALMRDVPGVTSPFEMGFLRPDDAGFMKDDHSHVSAAENSGGMVRISNQEIHLFISDLEKRTNDNWLPYLAFPIMDHSMNLMNLCDAGYTRGKFLPLKYSLRLIIQILSILNVAHSRNIVYRDHKILHFYWDESENGINIIDWNVARHHPSGLSPAEKSDDLVQFGARAMHHILTGRPAPGALPVGPNQPEEIDQAAKAYAPKWSYDDQRIPTRMKEITERVLVGHYDSITNLLNELTSLFQDLPDGS